MGQSRVFVARRQCGNVAMCCTLIVLNVRLHVKQWFALRKCLYMYAQTKCFGSGGNVCVLHDHICYNGKGAIWAVPWQSIMQLAINSS